MRCRVTARQAGTIRDLDPRKDLTLMDLSQDVREIKRHFGNRRAIKPFDGFLVKIENGEYTEVYGFYGQVAALYKEVYLVERTCR